jgi:hypothetical protein
MESRDHGDPGESRRNAEGHDAERRFGEEAYAYDRARTEGAQQGGGIASADHGPEGTANTGSGEGLSSGNAAGGVTTGDDAHTTVPPKPQSEQR